MKRSDMVMLLANRITVLQKQTCSLEEAYNVLNAIEELGMLPPDYLIEAGEREGLYVNEWEKE